MKFRTIEDCLNINLSFNTKELYCEFINRCVEKGIKWNSGHDLRELFKYNPGSQVSRVLRTINDSHDEIVMLVSGAGINFEGFIPNIENIE